MCEFPLHLYVTAYNCSTYCVYTCSTFKVQCTCTSLTMYTVFNGSTVICQVLYNCICHTSTST